MLPATEEIVAVPVVFGWSVIAVVATAGSVPNTYASNTVYFRLCFSTDGSSLEFSEGTPRLWEHDEGSSLNSSICGGTRAFTHKFCISSFVSSYSDVKPILAYCTF